MLFVKVLGNHGGGSVRPMSRPKSIVDIKISKLRQLSRQIRISLLFSRLKPCILQEQHLSGWQFSSFAFCLLTNYIMRKINRLIQKFRQMIHQVKEREFFCVDTSILLLLFQIGRAHVWTPVTWPSRIQSSA